MDLWTDGSCGNKKSKAGGWGVYCPALDIKLSGSDKETTNNRMEITAIINALQLIQSSDDSFSKVFSDSMWAINATTGKWNVTKNLDLVFEARELYRSMPNTNLVWIKGHSGNYNNDIADELARQAALSVEHS